MRRSRAFTLIELLVVIAIIGILAAIIFPVYARARVSAYRSSDITKMNELRSALQLYRADQGGYPPALLGYATLYTSGGNIVPADQVRSFLYSKRVSALETFRPAQLRTNNTATTTAVWPDQDPRAIGAAPILDLDGDGDVDANDDTADARQAFGPATTVTRAAWNPYNALEDIGNVGNGATNFAAYFYNVSGFDVANVPVPGGGNRTELRYALFWTNFGLGGGSANDDPRQLGYSEPPENTVVTWNSFFRDYTNGTPQRTKNDIVLFLAGNARPYDSVDMAQRSWRVLP